MSNGTAPTAANNDFEQLAALAEMRRNVNWHDDFFERLWLSTRSLHNRFGVTPEIERQIPLVREETNEAIAAAQHESDEALGKEIADSLVVLMGLAMARRLTLDLLHDSINAVIRKNDAKTLDTHKIDPKTLKIKRK